MKMGRTKPASIWAIGLRFFRFNRRHIIAPLLKRRSVSAPNDGREPAVFPTLLLEKIFMLPLHDFSRQPREANGTDAFGFSN